MSDPFRLQKIQNWAAEFAESDSVRTFPATLQQHAAGIVETFLVAACSVRDVEPDDLSEADMKSGLLNGVGKLSIPQPVRGNVPSLCASFLDVLQQQGRMPARRSSFIRALRPAFLSRPANSSSGSKSDAPKSKPITRPGTKLKPNDPCPCGSGKKYKKCCKRLLG